MKERKNLAEGEIKMITANIIYLAEKENKSKTAYFKQMVSYGVMKKARMSPSEMNESNRYEDLLRLCSHIGISINDLKMKPIAGNDANIRDDGILNEIFCDKTEYGLSEIRNRCKKLIDKKIRTSQMSLYALAREMGIPKSSLYESHGYWRLQEKKLKKIVVYFLNNGMKKGDFMTEEKMELENVVEVKSEIESVDSEKEVMSNANVNILNKALEVKKIEEVGGQIKIEFHGLVFDISNDDDRKKIIQMLQSKIKSIV